MWFPGLSINGHPDFMWSLSGQIVKTESGQEANHALWYTPARRCERVMRRGSYRRIYIETSGNPSEAALSKCESQVLSRDVVFIQIAWSQDASAAGNSRNEISF